MMAKKTAKATAKKAGAKKTAKATAKKAGAKKAAKATAKKAAKAGAKKAAKKAGAKKVAKKAGAKKTAKKAGAKKTAKKAGAKKAGAKKAAKKAGAKRTANATAKKAGATAKRAAAKKAGAKKVAGGDFAALIATIEGHAAGAGIALPAGASAAQIAAAERALGVTLPDDVKAWYRAHDGGGDNEYVVEYRELLSLAGIVDQWTIWKELLDDGVFGDNDHSEPGPGVQKKWWIPEWVPVTYDGSGNHHVIDLAPGPGGRRGQVMSFWHDDASRTVEGRSFLEWLAKAGWGESDA